MWPLWSHREEWGPKVTLVETRLGRKKSRQLWTSHWYQSMTVGPLIRESRRKEDETGWPITKSQRVFIGVHGCCLYSWYYNSPRLLSRDPRQVWSVSFGSDDPHTKGRHRTPVGPHHRSTVTRDRSYRPVLGYFVRPCPWRQFSETFLSLQSPSDCLTLLSFPTSLSRVVVQFGFIHSTPLYDLLVPRLFPVPVCLLNVFILPQSSVP